MIKHMPVRLFTSFIMELLFYQAVHHLSKKLEVDD